MGTQLDIFGREQERLDRTQPPLDAEKARRRYITEICTGHRVLDDAARAAVIRLVARGGLLSFGPFAEADVDNLADVLGLDGDPAIYQARLDGDDDTLQQAVETHIATSTDPLLILVAMLWDSHEPLVWAHQWIGAPEQTYRIGGFMEWINVLEGPLGYQWTDWEWEQVKILEERRP